MIRSTDHATSSPMVDIGPLSLPRSKLLAATSAGLVFLLLLFSLAPPTAPALLVGLALGTIGWIYCDRRGFSAQLATPLTLSLLGFIAWMFLSLLWSPNARVGFWSASWAALFALATLACVILGPRVAIDIQRRTGLLIVACVSLMIAVLAVEALTNMAMRRFVMTIFPAIRSTDGYAVIEAGRVLSLPSYLIKKNVAVSMLLFWPALLLATCYSGIAASRLLTALVSAIFAATIMIAGHDASKLALAASSIVWMLSWRFGKFAHASAVALWCASVLIVVPWTLALYHGGAHKMDAIQYSGRHRIVIWGTTSELVLKHPVRGAGLAATRYLDETGVDNPPFAPGTNIPISTNIHSHNIFLQTWHELGAVGALLLLAIGLSILQSVARAPAASRPYLYATFVAALAIVSLSWSLIAVWFMATLGAIAAIAVQATSLVRARELGQTGSDDLVKPRVDPSNAA